MLTHIRAALAAVVVAALATAAVAGGKVASKATAIPGEDEFRSATGYTVAVMEHCKAINKLARGKGTFNAELAREHAAEVARSVSSISRHRKEYVSALASGQRDQVSVEISTQESSESAIMHYSSALSDSLKGPAPNRMAVADAVTDLYLAAKDFLAAQKSAGKTLGIRAATPPRKAAPPKPRIKKGDEVIGEVKQ